MVRNTSRLLNVSGREALRSLRFFGILKILLIKRASTVEKK